MSVGGVGGTGGGAHIGDVGPGEPIQVQDMIHALEYIQKDILVGTTTHDKQKYNEAWTGVQKWTKTFCKDWKYMTDNNLWGSPPSDNEQKFHNVADSLKSESGKGYGIFTMVRDGNNWVPQYEPKWYAPGTTQRCDTAHDANDYVR